MGQLCVGWFYLKLEPAIPATWPIDKGPSVDILIGILQNNYPISTNKQLDSEMINLSSALNFPEPTFEMHFIGSVCIRTLYFSIFVDNSFQTGRLPLISRKRLSHKTWKNVYNKCHREQIGTENGVCDNYIYSDFLNTGTYAIIKIRVLLSILSLIT